MTEQTYPARIAELEAFSRFLEEEFEKHDIPLRVAMQTQVAAEEIFVNIANYAYPEKSGTVRVALDFADRRILLRFEDSGIAFDPLSRVDPDISLSAEEREIGGLGIFMVKKTMDDVSYEYRDRKNILTLQKKY